MRTLALVCVFLGSFLLFSIELIAGRKLLPIFGGGFSVWTTSMLFYLFFVFLGYVGSHFLMRSKFARLFHVVLLLLSLLQLNQDFSASATTSNAFLGVLNELLRSISLPFLALCFSTPMFHHYMRKRFAKVSFGVYALSNLASFAAIMAFVLLLEPFIPLDTQITGWRILFVVYLLCSLGFILTGKSEVDQRQILSLSKADFLMVVGLSASGVMIMLSVNTIIAQELITLPFIWAITLGIYLLTLVFAFSAKPPRAVGILFFLALAITIFFVFASKPLGGEWNIGKILLVLLAEAYLCFVAHQRMAQLSPNSESGSLGIYYIAMSTGGVIASLFLSIFMPLISAPMIVDLVASVVLLLFLLVVSNKGEVFSFKRWIPRLGLCVALVLVLLRNFSQGNDVYTSRNFYGIHRVSETALQRALYHGATIHGLAWLDPEKEAVPLSYYGELSPAASVFPHVEGPVAIAGLGTGALLSYAKADQPWDLFEIDPEVIKIAHEYFRFIANSKGKLSFQVGDARMSIQKSQRKYELIVLDVFSGDAIPIHLLSKEAIQIFWEKLDQDGSLLIHISSRYLNLKKILSRLAGTVDGTALWGLNTKEHIPGNSRSEWVLITKDQSLAETLLTDSSWLSLPIEEGRPWSDQLVNIWQAF